MSKTQQPSFVAEAQRPFRGKDFVAPTHMKLDGMRETGMVTGVDMEMVSTLPLPSSLPSNSHSHSLLPPDALHYASGGGFGTLDTLDKLDTLDTLDTLDKLGTMGTLEGDALPPVTPGEILAEEFMQPLGLTARGLAAKLGVPPNRISEIIKGRRMLTADTALRLEAHFGVSAEFWLNLQMNYDLRVARAAV
ncbi:MAG: HigA family addiction module antitoxin [Candidatus Symbiobacter sp.]|nr:HigA family addiction module antitoxin [Candidatus Symbiobacter sp.]